MAALGSVYKALFEDLHGAFACGLYAFCARAHVHGIIAARVRQPRFACAISLVIKLEKRSLGLIVVQRLGVKRRSAHEVQDRHLRCGSTWLRAAALSNFHGERVSHSVGGVVCGVQVLVAALHGDGGAVCHGHVRRALVRGVAHKRAHLIVLVGGSGRHLHRCGALWHGQGVAVGILGEALVELAGGEGDARKRAVRVVRVAQVVHGAGVHHADLVAGGKPAVCHRVGGKALVGEPVVQGAHPAGVALALGVVVVSVVLGQALDLADVAVVGAHLRLARALDGGLDAAHHGGVRGKRHICIHERARPRRVGRGAGGVLHDYVDATQVCRGLIGQGFRRHNWQQACHQYQR